MQYFQSTKLLERMLYIVLGIAFGLFVIPLKSFAGIVLNELALKISPNLILQLWGTTTFLLLVIIGFLILRSYNLRSKFNYKRVYFLGAYWHQLKPYCPYCGDRLDIHNNEYPFCNGCNHRVNFCDPASNQHYKINEAIEYVKTQI
jgi:hypothetical protein